MATINPNKIVGALEGKLGDLVFVQRQDGVVIVKRKPVRTAETTPGEAIGQDRFKGAVAYVRGLKRSPQQYALYERVGRERRKRGCDLAMTDFLKSPRVTEIDLSEYWGLANQEIRILAVDDFQVQSVQVVIASPSGALLEEGPAVLGTAENSWIYRVNLGLPIGNTVTIHVSAADIPGNRVTKSVDHALIKERQTNG